LRSLLVLALGLVAFPCIGATTDTTWVHERWWNGLFRLEPYRERVARVASLLIERDAGLIALEEGSIALARPIEGRVCAAFFRGRGRFVLAPRQAIERSQLQRLYRAPVFHRDFESLLIVFGDTTAASLSGALEFSPGAFVRDEAETRALLEGCVVEKNRHVDASVARTLLEGRSNRHFLVAFRSGSERFRFEIDPYTSEEVSLTRLPVGASPQEEITRFRLDGLESDDLESDLRPPLTIDAYRIDVTLSASYHPTYAVELEGEVLEDSLRFLPLILNDLQAVDSVRWVGEDAAPRFWWAPDNRNLWIDAARRLSRGERLRLRVHYRGKPLRAGQGLRMLGTSPAWYPLVDSKQRARFDLTFRYPRDLQLVAVGDRVAIALEDRQRVARWRAEEPIRNASWCVGRFTEKSFESDSARVTVLIDRLAHTAAGRVLIEQGISSGKDIEEQVAHDLLQSVRFFDHVFGPIARRELYAVDAWTEHSEAHAGTLHLGWQTLQRTDRAGEDEALRAHEVAHQWWPLDVDYKTYRDRWLSEGFAEFAGLWYMHIARKNSELYQKALNARRDQILLHRDAGSTWLGHRVETSQTVGPDYQVAVYDRGAWVFHMLRNYLIDLQTLDERRFVEMLRDVRATHRGGRISTADFARIVEKHAGHSMDWFFRQWVRGTDLPEYRVSWKNEAAAGRHVLKLRVEQRGVPEGFRMPVLVRVDLGQGQYARSRVWVDQPVVEKEIALPEPARKVTFNELNSVLCVVRMD
jgi:hypothetical protein